MNSVLHTLDSLILIEQQHLPNFPEGSAQHSLLKNRIEALQISKQLLSRGSTPSLAELEFALPRIQSILQKTSKAKERHHADSRICKRLEPTVQTMTVIMDKLIAAIEHERT